MISRLRLILNIVFVTFWSLSATVVFAEESTGGDALSAGINRAHAAGVPFTDLELFQITTGGSYGSILAHETILTPMSNEVEKLYRTRPHAVSLTVHGNDGQDYKLDMLQAQPTAEQPNMGTIDAGGRHRIAYDAGLHYQGSVVGSAHSLAAMSVFSNGDVMLLFADERGNFVLGKLDDGTGKYILYNDRDMKNRPPTSCAVRDDGPSYGGNIQPKTTKSLLCNKVMLYWEIGYGLYTLKGSLINTQNYVTGLFNEFQAMYANERIAVQLKSMYVWVAQDDIPTATSSAALGYFRSSWNALGNGFDGDLSHLITRTTKGLGGIAALDVLCNKQYGNAFSDINGSFSTVPTFSWDVEVLTHETGHNFGSKHTHWCGWMTGSGGSCGSIDDCTAQETTGSCSSCGATNLNSAPLASWKGSVMSYCHIVSRGINLANGFGTLPGNFIRARVSSSTCLNDLISAKLTPTPICGNTGAVTLAYAADNSGTAPYSYNWSNSARTQNLSSLTTPGTFSVSIQDSNGCTANYSTNVTRSPSPGNGITPSQKMPICCRSSTVPLSLTASMPQNLAACQTVYWLRSAAVLSSYSAAKAYFDTTATANILVSTNAAGVSNSTAAVLDVFPPATCATQQTFYYTPVVAVLPHAADSIVSASATNTAFKFLSTTIGSSVNLPDQSTLPTSCDLLDTPTRQTLTVSVTSYTGRANNMRLVVRDGSNNVLYERFGMTGNGTYVIPASALSGPMLQAMSIVAYDLNCSNTTCTTAAATVSASRKVVYGSRPATAAAACASGTSIKVIFAQTACTKLDVPGVSVIQSNSVSIYPNPASQSVTVAYMATGAAPVSLRVTDMLGKTLAEQIEWQQAGRHQFKVDVGGWAKGVYFITIGGAGESGEQFKLLVD